MLDSDTARCLEPSDRGAAPECQLIRGGGRIFRSDTLPCGVADARLPSASSGNSSQSWKSSPSHEQRTKARALASTSPPPQRPANDPPSRSTSGGGSSSGSALPSARRPSSPAPFAAQREASFNSGEAEPGSPASSAPGRLGVESKESASERSLAAVESSTQGLIPAEVSEPELVDAGLLSIEDAADLLEAALSELSRPTAPSTVALARVLEHGMDPGAASPEIDAGRDRDSLLDGSAASGSAKLPLGSPGLGEKPGSPVAAILPKSGSRTSLATAASSRTAEVDTGSEGSRGAGQASDRDSVAGPMLPGAARNAEEDSSAAAFGNGRVRGPTPPRFKRGPPMGGEPPAVADGAGAVPARRTDMAELDVEVAAVIAKTSAMEKVPYLAQLPPCFFLAGLRTPGREFVSIASLSQFLIARSETSTVPPNVPPSLAVDTVGSSELSVRPPKSDTSRSSSKATGLSPLHGGGKSGTSQNRTPEKGAPVDSISLVKRRSTSSADVIAMWKFPLPVRDHLCPRPSLTERWPESAHDAMIVDIRDD